MKDPDEGSLAYPGWRVAAGSMVALTLAPSTVGTFGLGLFISPLRASFGWTLTQVALASTIVSLMMVVLSPLQGLLADRFGVRRIMLPSIPAFALAVAALSLLPKSLAVYYAGWVLITILGMGLLSLAYMKAVSSWFGRRLGTALGLANAGTAIGGMVMPLIVESLIESYGWRIAYVGLGALILVVTFPTVALLVRERPAAISAPDRPQSLTGATYAEATRSPAFALLALVFLLVGFTNIAMITQQVPLLRDAGMKPMRAALVLTNFGAFGLIGRLFTGVLLDRVPAPLVMAVACLGGALACALYAGGARVELAFVSSALIGLLFGAEFDVLAYLIKSNFGVRAFGKLYGTIFSIFQLGAAAGAAFLPMSRDRFGGYGPGLMVFAALLVAAAAVVACVRTAPRSARFAEAQA